MKRRNSSINRRRNNAELTTSTTPRQLLSLHALLGNLLECIDVIVRAKTELALGSESSTVGDTLGVDDDGVLRTAADVDGGANLWDLSGPEADTGLLAIIETDELGVLDLGISELNAELATVDTAPDIALAVLGNGGRMMGTAA